MSARERHLADSLAGRQTGLRSSGMSSRLFRPLTLIALIFIGLFAFGALIALGGFADDLRKPEAGQASPRSTSAVGYRALVDYLERLDLDVQELNASQPSYLRSGRLSVYFPARPNDIAARELVKYEDDLRLIVLPKWRVVPFKPRDGETAQPGWARKTGRRSLIAGEGYRKLLQDIPVIVRHDIPSPDAQVFFGQTAERDLPAGYAPDLVHMQTFDLSKTWTEQIDILKLIREAQREERRRKRGDAEGRDDKPAEDRQETETDDVEKADGESEVGQAKTREVTATPPEIIMKLDGKPVLIRLADTQTYILSEPDLLNTTAFQTQSGARFALAIFEEIARHAEISPGAIDIDLSLHGLQNNRNIVKLMLTPPFLAATLCLLAAGGLVAWQGFNRFGDPARLRPDYAQGPVSLAETAAEFMEIAGRAHKTGGEYAALIRQQVAQQLGVSAGLGGRTLADRDSLLDARETRLNITPGYAVLRDTLAQASPQSYPDAARALTRWRESMTDDTLHRKDTPT